jgi:hypothetical protein
MLIYEVNVVVQSDTAGEYAAFLASHIPQILQVDGFKGATWWERRPEDENAQAMDGKTLWTIHYQVESRLKLEHYLKNQAAAMRAEAQRRFGSRISINRRILALRSEHSPT